VGTTDPEVAARLDCVNHLITLSTTLQALSPAVNSTNGIKEAAHAASQAGQQIALAEDWQLRGFLPLQQCHSQLVFEHTAVQVCCQADIW